MIHLCSATALLQSLCRRRKQKSLSWCLWSKGRWHSRHVASLSPGHLNNKHCLAKYICLKQNMFSPLQCYNSGDLQCWPHPHFNLPPPVLVSFPASLHTITGYDCTNVFHSCTLPKNTDHLNFFFFFNIKGPSAEIRSLLNKQKQVKLSPAV